MYPTTRSARWTVDQLCFVKDASGWKIGGYAGGDN